MAYECYYGFNKSADKFGALFQDYLIRDKGNTLLPKERYGNKHITKSVCFSSYCNYYKETGNMYYGFRINPDHIYLVDHIADGFSNIDIKVVNRIDFNKGKIDDYFSRSSISYTPCGALDNPSMTYVLTEIKVSDKYSKDARRYMLRILAGLVRMFCTVEYAYSAICKSDIKEDNVLKTLVEVNNEVGSGSSHSFCERWLPLGAVLLLDDPDVMNNLEYPDESYYIPVTSILEKVKRIFDKRNEQK